MTTYPLANTLYSNQYSVVTAKQHLHTLKSHIFCTHISSRAEKLHRLSKAIFIPASFNAQLLGYVIEPLPGKHKDYPLKGLMIRVVALLFWTATLPLAMIALSISLPLRRLEHRYRPAISYIHNSSSTKAKKEEDLVFTQEKPFHIRTHNVGFVSPSMSIPGDLRPPRERAKELVVSITEDPLKPDMIFFQEAFHEEATRILCEGIKEEYPYIIHNVAPQISGFSSGCMIASKYPLEYIEFRRLSHMLGPERVSPRGVIKIRLNSAKGPLILYGTHMQALIGEERANARFHQLEEISKLMKEDLIKEPHALQILVGDFNTSRVTTWGEDNLSPQGQAEEKVFNRLNTYFDDLYLKDHDALTGKRTKDTPVFLQVDNARLDEPHLVEPSGSWYHGPLAKPGVLLSLKMHLDRKGHKRPHPHKVKEISVKKSLWGTPEWHGDQTANTARLDYLLLPKHQSKLDGHVEIRRVFVPKNVQSASSDHLPVDGRFWTINPS
jgi:endonuclease/exonuclease/phosphatase family metal-dependent hydrolase